MDIYHYNRDTGEFQGQDVADPDPMEEGNWLIPAWATSQAPPEPEPGFARVYRNALWAQEEDHRGEVWWDTAGNSVIVDFLGDPRERTLTDVEPIRPPVPARPELFAAVALVVSGGALETIELAAGLSGAMYEEGWLMVLFSQSQVAANYLVFAQTDIPAKVEQFKDNGSFELVFTDPATGDPVEPGRVDLQILKVG